MAADFRGHLADLDSYQRRTTLRAIRLRQDTLPGDERVLTSTSAPDGQRFSGIRRIAEPLQLFFNLVFADGEGSALSE